MNSKVTKKIQLSQVTNSYLKLKCNEYNLTHSSYIENLIIDDLLQSLSIKNDKISKININSNIINDLKSEFNVQTNEQLIECLVKYYINNSIRGWNEWI